MAHEIRDGRLAPEREIDAKKLARTHAGKSQRGFAQGLARDRAGVDPGAADFAKFFDERDTFAKNSRGIRSGNAGRPAADHDYVEVSCHRCVLRGESKPNSPPRLPRTSNRSRFLVIRRYVF